MQTPFAELEHFGMNTVMTHRAYGRHAEQALRAVRAEAGRLERLLSRFVPGSDVARINRSAGARSERVGRDAWEVLSRAAEFSRASGGLFDVTVAPLVDLWRGCRETREPPCGASIGRALALVGHADLALDARRRAAGLARAGQSIDLGGIGKGWAGDRFVEVLRRHGVASAFTNIGGNVVTLGAKPDGSPWRVGIRHPRREGLIGTVAVAGKAVVTSGDDQRYFIGTDGSRYHHLLNPATGYPADAGLLSATVVADGSMDADALSTILFAAGLEKGLALLRRFAGAQAIVVDAEGKVTVTAGLEGSFQAAEGIETTIVR